MTRKKSLIALISAIALIIAGALAVMAYTTMQNEKRKNTDDTIVTQDKNSQDTIDSVETGRSILLTQFGAKFALPKNFDVTDTRIAYQKADRYEVAYVTSYTLADNLKKDQCRGWSLDLGAFAEITRYSSPQEGQDLKKVGNYYYRVDEGGGYNTCYDAPLYEKYYDPAVVQAIRKTLQTQ